MKNLNSLGIDKTPEQTRVVVAMSGGVDSSVTAALLHEQGYQVIGITLQLYDHGAMIGKKGACCAGQDIYDARNVADSLGIPHYILDYESRFRDEVMNEFADAYVRGETPIPCVMCNQTVKFRDLLKTAKELGADALATGHYVQRKVGPDGAQLHKAEDASKDQSYFLFTTTNEQIDFIRFPLGGHPKSVTRDLAHKYGLIVSDKPDSQDICFVPNGDYATIVKKLRPEAGQPGQIVHLDGRVLGDHQGIIHYTIGQRKGLGIGGNIDPLYVIHIDPENYQVIVGPYEALAKQQIIIKDVNWLADPLSLERGIEADVRLRSSGSSVPATIKGLGSNRALVTLLAPQHGISPGQACVVYDDSRVLGGGWITREEIS